MPGEMYQFRAKVWKYTGKAAWHFVTVPKKTSDAIKSARLGRRVGWGMVAVTVIIGDVRWKTSIFPDSKSDAFLLPLKAAIRKKTGIKEGDTVAFVLETT